MCRVFNVGLSSESSPSFSPIMRTFSLALLILQLGPSLAIVSNKTDDLLQLFVNFDGSTNEFSSTSNKCSLRIQSSLDKLRKRQASTPSSAYIDLSGYALHQSLRRAPFDMYVTDIKVRTPGVGNWVRVEKCQFSDNRLTAEIIFNDLAVTGNVKLLDENSPYKELGRKTASEFCSMTARLKRAGLGINAFPARGRSKGIDVRTEARFVDPNYLSLHAYGCKLSQTVGGLLQGAPLGHRRQDFTEFGRFGTEENEARHRAGLVRPPDADRSDDGAGDSSGLRIVTLLPRIPGREGSTLQLHGEEETDLNDYHKERLMSGKYQNERNRLQAILHVKNLIAQQANQVFQTHGPFSHQITNIRKPLFEPHNSQQVQNVKPVSVISTITELDENLSPVVTQHHGPQGTYFPTVGDQIVTSHNNEEGVQFEFEEISREMEDTFLRGIKTLLTKYLEKQLEMPLKEALMVSIGYTVSYG